MASITHHESTPVAVVTGASRGLGRALAEALAAASWHVVGDGREAAALHAATAALPSGSCTAIPGDVRDAEHRRRVAAAAAAAGPVQLLVNSASSLGPSPLPPLSDLSTAALRDLLDANVIAPHALTRLLLPDLAAAGGRVVNVTSDAAVQAYPGWGGYAASKAALERLTATLAEERPELRVYALDPGDMNTAMHQLAFPGEDISDRPEPASVVPALWRLLDGTLPSGRYRAVDLAAEHGMDAVAATRERRA